MYVSIYHVLECIILRIYSFQYLVRPGSMIHERNCWPPFSWNEQVSHSEGHRWNSSNEDWNKVDQRPFYIHGSTDMILICFVFVSFWKSVCGPCFLDHVFCVPSDVLGQPGKHVAMTQDPVVESIPKCCHRTQVSESIYERPSGNI